MGVEDGGVKKEWRLFRADVKELEERKMSYDSTESSYTV
jgi:hypothetical protein